MNFRFAMSVTIWVGLTVFATAQDIGVAACDEYMAKFDACMRKQPVADRVQLEKSLSGLRGVWQQLASSPQMKPSLEGICRGAIEGAKAEYGGPPHNCAF